MGFLSANLDVSWGKMGCLDDDKHQGSWIAGKNGAWCFFRGLRAVKKLEFDVKNLMVSAI